MTARLDKFFQAMGPFLEGRTTVADVEATLGTSPSGSERLALYRTLVVRQRREVLGGLFSAVQAACSRVDPDLWDTLTKRFAVEHPPTHWEPNRFGAGFAEFLSRARALDPTLPLYLEELADYAFVRFAASVAPHPTDGVGLDSALFVRRYEYDVVELTRRGVTEPPRSRPCTLIVAWSATSHSVVELQPSLAALAAVGRRLGNFRALELQGAPTLDAIDQAERDLVSRGVLASLGASETLHVAAHT